MGGGNRRRGLLIVSLICLFVISVVFVWYQFFRNRAKSIVTNTFTINGINRSLKIDNVLVSSIGDPSTDRDYKYLVTFVSGDFKVKLWFPNGAKAPYIIDLSKESEAYGFDITQATQFGSENSVTQYCDNFDKGRVEIADYSTGPDGYIETIAGDVDIQMSGCEIKALGIKDKDISIQGNFDIDVVDWK